MRYILLLLTLIAFSAATGCRMCAHPYDYCGPTYVGPCGTVCCNPDARAGSVLSPPLDSAAVPEMIVDEGSVESSDEAPLEPIPRGEEVAAPPEIDAEHVVPLPAPPRSARTTGPTFLR